MKRFVLLLAISMMAGAMLVPAQSGAYNSYSCLDLPQLIPGDDGHLYVPLMIFDKEVLICSSLSSGELQLKLPLIETGYTRQHVIIPVSMGTSSQGSDDLLYIELDGQGTPPPPPEELFLDPTETDCPGAGETIYSLDIDPRGISNGWHLLLPLVNIHPQSDGYAAPLIFHDGGYVIPLLREPNGHLSNGHVLYNPWGMAFDDYLTLDYRVIHL